MANETMVLLEKIVVPSGGASSVTFTSIPQTYTDLVVKMSGRDNRSANGTDVYIGFNGVTTNLSMRRLYGDSSAPYSSNASTGNIGIESAANATASTFGNLEVYIPNYTGSNNKSYSADSVSESNASNAGSAFAQITAGLWSSSAAITQIDITPVAGNSFVQYTTAYLYGIAKEGVTPSTSSAPYATGGDSIVFDGTYWIHTFYSSGTVS